MMDDDATDVEPARTRHGGLLVGHCLKGVRRCLRVEQGVPTDLGVPILRERVERVRRRVRVSGGPHPDRPDAIGCQNTESFGRRVRRAGLQNAGVTEPALGGRSNEPLGHRPMIASDRQPKHRPVGHDRQPDLLTVSDELKGARTTHHRHSHSATPRAQRGRSGHIMILRAIPLIIVRTCLHGGVAGFRPGRWQGSRQMPRGGPRARRAATRSGGTVK
jgi:hypothetical protein